MATPTTDHLHEPCTEAHPRHIDPWGKPHCVECGEPLADPATCEHPGAIGRGWPEDPATIMRCTACAIPVRSPRSDESPILPSGLTAMWVAR